MGNFGMLPTDIRLEILSYLPIESLLECKLVSKSWRSLVKHRSFSQILLKRLDSTENSGKLIFLCTEWSDENFPYAYTEYNEHLNCFGGTKRISLRPPFERYDIVGSCNGLICFYELGYESVYICNPVTREYVVIPISEFEEADYLIGFGYVPSTNEFKVVRICNSRRDPNFGIVQVYTLGSGSGWRSGIKVDCYLKLTYLSSRCGVFSNGSVHWVVQPGKIVAFNLADEVFRVLPSPPFFKGDDPAYGLHVLDCLCAYHHHDGVLDIWVLEKNHDTYVWSKHFSNLNWQDHPITVTRSGLLCYSSNDEAVLYGCTPEGLCPRMFLDLSENLALVVPHKNTLVSLKALGEEDTELMRFD